MRDQQAVGRVSIQPLLAALDVQEDAARALADGLRTQIEELQSQLREAETRLEHLAITRKTVTALADRLPAQTSGRPARAPWTTPASSLSSTRPSPPPPGP
ncbi:hypothetical protein AB0H45_06120 [Streptomyces atroolivaceus]|uniref:hypothetical protein n=1 Tax=Streptomyces atroolivaceus TaxID=66869 RepID=UPI0033CF0E7B